MTSHHDVADSVAWLRQPRWIEGSFRKKLFDIADLLESQAKALSEAERTSCGDWASQRENDARTIVMYDWKARALAAEARLAEAMKVIEPFAFMADASDFKDNKAFQAARAFTNAAKD